jgi:hypothetical protein
MRALGVVALGVMVACSGDDVVDEGPATCDGGGPLLVEVGSGGQLDFVPFADGDEATLRVDETIEVQLLTSGLDTTDSVTVSVRTSIGGGTTRDSLNTFNLVCSDDTGRGWLGAYPFVPEGAVAGDRVLVVATVTDAAGTAASGEVELLLVD